MHSALFALSIASVALAARPFWNEVHTGLEEFLGPHYPRGQLPDLEDIWDLHDFEYAARNVLNRTSYSWYRHASGGEYTYRNNMEIFPRVGFKPRVLTGASHVKPSMKTSIMGHEFSAPFYISPAAGGAYGNPEDKELGLVKAAHTQDILYVPSLYADMTIEEIAAAKAPGQVTFQQLYAQHDRNYTQDILDRAKKAGAKAIFWTVDVPVDGNRIRNERYAGASDTAPTIFTWKYLDTLREMTDLPIILKGITTVDDAKKAVDAGADGIILSNHGGRQVDTSPSPVQVAVSIHDEAPEIFSQIEVYADSGIRFGSDVLKLLALGVKAVGLGRSFMYANVYGQEGVERAIDLLKKEVLRDAINIGVTELSQLDSSYLDLNYLRAHEWDMW